MSHIVIVGWGSKHLLRAKQIICTNLFGSLAENKGLAGIFFLKSSRPTVGIVCPCPDPRPGKNLPFLTLYPFPPLKNICILFNANFSYFPFLRYKFYLPVLMSVVKLVQACFCFQNSSFGPDNRFSQTSFGPITFYRQLLKEILTKS